jgi:general L-amino acid transport system permease protein
MAYSTQTILPRSAPANTTGVWRWLRMHLFADIFTGAATVLLVILAIKCGVFIFDWGIQRAVWVNQVELCDASNAGACWGAIVEKYRLILFGRYPFEAQWRPLLATLLMMSMVVVSCIRACWKPWLMMVWLIGFTVFFILMRGFTAGLADALSVPIQWSLALTEVETDRWGGFPLTLFLATVSIGLAFPLALMVALGRVSHLPAIRAFCTIYIELIRGVPLISVLFMASFLLPLLMPQGFTVDVLLRVMVGMTLFTAAYMAEVIRGGIQAIPKGQFEAAASLGLSYWQTQRCILLPQALSIVIPSLMNNFIAVFIDTSLVTTVSLYELMGAHSLAFNSDADWRPYKVEGYLFIAFIYFIVCFAMARYSAWVERQANKGRIQ